MLITFAKGNLYIFSILIVCISLIILSFSFTTTVEAQRDEGTVAGIWTFDDGTANDSSNKGLNGITVGAPKSVNGIVGKALEFNGTSDGINIPDSPDINTVNNVTNRTIAAFLNCHDVSKSQKQVIFEEGGRTRGMTLYVFEGKVYIGAWNRAEYNWNGEWLSADIKSNTWYHIALVIRDGAGAVEKDKFEFWLDGKLKEKADGGQLHPHADNNGLGYLNQNTVYHDNEGAITVPADFFDGLLDEVIIFNSAFDQGDFNSLAAPLSVEAQGKFTTTWGYLKTKRLTN